MAEFVYILCAVTSLVCTVLLLRSYRGGRSSLVFWSGICFLLLTGSNVLIFVDLVLVPQIDLLMLRNGITLLALSLLLYSLIKEST
jgi:hypothetical protein